jgi:hypothetical protein
LSAKDARGTAVAICFSNQVTQAESTMTTQAEVIAMVMSDDEGTGRMQRMATVLLRGADGQMSVRTVSPDSTLGQFALSTGCFRQGAPIIDPITHAHLGYEMERLDSPFAALA